MDMGLPAYLPLASTLSSRGEATVYSEATDRARSRHQHLAPIDQHPLPRAEEDAPTHPRTQTPRPWPWSMSSVCEPCEHSTWTQPAPTSAGARGCPSVVSSWRSWIRTGMSLPRQVVVVGSESRGLAHTYPAFPLHPPPFFLFLFFILQPTTTQQADAEIRDGWDGHAWCPPHVLSVRLLPTYVLCTPYTYLHGSNAS